MQFAATGETERKLSKKADLDDMHRIITTISLTSTEYDLLATLPAREVIKQRRRIPCGGGHVSIDQFGGSLRGLRLVEREFENDEEMRLYQPPAFAGIEVTMNPKYSGGWLAEHGLTETVG